LRPLHYPRNSKPIFPLPSDAFLPDNGGVAFWGRLRDNHPGAMLRLPLIAASRSIHKFKIRNLQSEIRNLQGSG
jgi:hypothetical protein